MRNSFQRKGAKVQRRGEMAGARTSVRFMVYFCEGLELPDWSSVMLKRTEVRAPFNFASLHLCAFALKAVSHRSHSPITKSNDPKIAVISLTMCPGNRCDKMLRFTNDGARIFIRYGVPPPLLLM